MTGFLELLGRLAVPEGRREATAGLAGVLGGERLLLFAPDPELGVVLPAPGFPQVLPGAAEWRKFLEACAREGQLAGTVPGPDGEPVPVLGLALPDGTAAVLVRPRGNDSVVAPLRPLLPLLGALFRAERQITADAARARSAADAVERAQVLNGVLQEMRQRLEEALMDAQQARSEAKERAEHAESLAVELEELNHELMTRTQEAERARASADEANRAKSEFLANMSHELRTPINAVIGYAELLTLGISGPVTADQLVQLERIRASSAHLLSLINDVLDLSKVEAGRMAVEHERESAAEVVAEAVALIQGEAAAQQLTLENACRDPELMYVGDRDRVRQILVNLLSNAVKFTERGGGVVVRGGTRERLEDSTDVAGEGPWTYVTVEDTGIGMTPDQLPRVFQAFVQADSGHTRRRGGTGLGLTISRQFARLMGGDLTVRSEAGQGSRFTLWLPAASAGSGPLDATIRVGAASGSGPFPEGLAQVGAHLQAELRSIVSGFARRVRTELPVSLVAEMDQGEIMSHALILLADVAAILMRLGRFGGDPSLAGHGSDVQRLIAEEYGADRGRRGWTGKALRREFELLREEVVSALRSALDDVAGVDLDGAIRLLDRLLEAAQRTSLWRHSAAVVGAGSRDAP